METNLIIEEQVELSRRMVDFTPVLNGYYSTLTLQFGYMTIFGIFFPLGLFYLAFANIVMCMLTIFAFSNHCKRSLTIESSGIGVWKDILVVVGYFAAIYNIVALIFTGNGLLYIFGDVNATRDLIILLIFEHALLGLKTLVGGLVQDIPEWVKRRKNFEQYLDERNSEKILAKYKVIKIRNQTLKQLDEKVISTVVKAPTYFRIKETPFIDEKTREEEEKFRIRQTKILEERARLKREQEEKEARER